MIILEITKNNRKGFEIECSACKTKIFRTRRQFYSKPLHFCRSCNTKYLNVFVHETSIHNQDNNFFLDRNLTSIYWAGFIAADGYINEKENYVSIKLKETDQKHLEKFLEVTNSTNNVLDSNDKTDGQNKTPRKRIVISNKNWIQCLKQIFNIHQAKSLTHQPPDDSAWTDEERKAFIIGYLDGDGTICRIGKDRSLKLGFIGTLEFMTWVKNFLVNYYSIELKPTSIQHRKNCPNKNVYELNIYCSKANKILQDLKQLPIYKLERKWNRI